MKYFILDQFLSEKQCNDLIEMSKSRLTRARGHDVATGQETESDYRTAHHTFYQKRENPLVTEIENKVSQYTRTPPENAEGLSVIFYNGGGYYKVHYDYFDPAYAGNQPVLARGGQRIMTVLMYLNTVANGGATYFPNVNLTVSPIQGRAIIWLNVLDDMQTVDPSTFHEGQPPIDCDKWCATLWIRANTFH